ncbi:MAG: hypothetical protein QOJ50_2874 [Cryptosporangiaceae bacterium]|nr:hypothetical protein [Cryptosporangiaceae bacterium]
MQRTARLIVSHGREVLGQLGPFPVATPWWADTGPVAAGASVLLGTPATVLRLVSVSGGEHMAGGEVTYHCEVAARPGVALAAVPPVLNKAVTDPHPLRAPFAEPGAVAQVLAWAAAELPGPPRAFTQVKTWNLSCVLRLDTGCGPVWCKWGRTFETAEPVPIALVAERDPGLVPHLLAARPQDRITLLADVPGEDCWDAGVDLVAATVRRWVAVQGALADADLPGLPRWEPETLPGRIERALAAAALTKDERARAAQLADTAVAGGLPATLVHGDFHSGNWRGYGGPATILDWTGAYRGHPVDDLLTLVRRLGPDRAAAATAAWCSAWRDTVPGCDPEVALASGRALFHLGKAALYQHFLDHIEPSERPYHEPDPAAEIRAALAAGSS